mmetsp:Transcript_22709/g.32938  ORF Transcript_22709/g.32938 Transcript_22709/m.32938 type:complete len:289 (+) Transcript_22709:235-1101(+)
MISSSLNLGSLDFLKFAVLCTVPDCGTRSLVHRRQEQGGGQELGGVRSSHHHPGEPRLPPLCPALAEQLRMRPQALDLAAHGGRAALPVLDVHLQLFHLAAAVAHVLDDIVLDHRYRQVRVLSKHIQHLHRRQDLLALYEAQQLLYVIPQILHPNVFCEVLLSQGLGPDGGLAEPPLTPPALPALPRPLHQLCQHLDPEVRVPPALPAAEAHHGPDVPGLQVVGAHQVRHVQALVEGHLAPPEVRHLDQDQGVVDVVFGPGTLEESQDLFLPLLLPGGRGSRTVLRVG